MRNQHEYNSKNLMHVKLDFPLLLLWSLLYGIESYCCSLQLIVLILIQSLKSFFFFFFFQETSFLFHSCLLTESLVFLWHLS